ncbi:hypothetical protein Tco_1328128 [Tanacetum coccineum]
MFETFSDHTEKTGSGSTTTHADNSLPEYDSFLFETEPGQGELTSVVIEDILGEPRVYVPNVLPTHTTLMMNSDFIPSDDSLGSDLEVSFPSGTRNKIFYLGIFFEVSDIQKKDKNEVRIRQISQKNRQKRENTDMRTEECARARSQSQKVNPQSKSTVEDKDLKVSNSVP